MDMEKPSAMVKSPLQLNGAVLETAPFQCFSSL